MTTTAVVRWSVAVAVFLMIGVIDLRYGHVAGFVTLIGALLVVFFLDLGARKQ